MNEATKKLLHARVYGHFVMVLVYMDLIKKIYEHYEIKRENWLWLLCMAHDRDKNIHDFHN